MTVATFETIVARKPADLDTLVAAAILAGKQPSGSVFNDAKGNLCQVVITSESAVATVTATVGGGTTGLIPRGASFCTVVSDNADKQISLPAADVGDEYEFLVTGAACELISSVAAHKVNNVVVGATNEAALVQDAWYRAKYVAENLWILTGETKLGARIAAIVPDAL